MIHVRIGSITREVLDAPKDAVENQKISPAQRTTDPQLAARLVEFDLIALKMVFADDAIYTFLGSSLSCSRFEVDLLSRTSAPKGELRRSDETQDNTDPRRRHRAGSH